MPITLRLLLLIVAIVFLVLAAFGVNARLGERSIGLGWIGLALWLFVETFIT